MRSFAFILFLFLAGWVAAAEPHWAFVPPVRPALSGAGNPIDVLISVEQQKRSIEPQPPAAKSLLLRRVFLDLIGLPPTRAELHAFLADESPDAYERVVGRLLASPQHAERWARHFMDVWRYADWYGLGEQLRNSQKHIWHWRDWIIESLRDDRPYDRMIREMLAGDEAAPTDPRALAATGFLARNYYLFNRNTWLEDTIEHTGKAFLGLTLNCAKCHDHKYDPITQQDYYRFRAIFEPHQIRLDSVPGQADLEKDGLPRAFDAHADAPTYLFVRGDERNPDKSAVLAPGLPAVLTFAPLDIEAVSLPPEVWAPNTRAFVEADFLKKAADDLAALRAAVGPARDALAKAKPGGKSKAVDALVAALDAVNAAEKRPDQLRAALAAERAGQPPGAASPRSSRKAFEGPTDKEDQLPVQFPSSSTGRRLALANWITDRRNPLTARVLVNHVWMRHFGEPLVPSVFDFGKRCPPPATQPLLDWLAVEFMEHGWSLRHLHHLIVTSDAYRRSSQASASDGKSQSIDPDNKFLWHFPGRRMESELVRDSVLALSGDLDLTKIGGPPVPPGDTASRRRSLYFTQNLEDRHVFLNVFDASRVTECYRRNESVVPQQALALANSALIIDAAPKIAARIEQDGGDFIAGAFEALLGRQPSRDEHVNCEKALADLEKLNPSRAKADLVHTLLNHNNFVSIR